MSTHTGSSKYLTIIDTFGNINDFYLDESGTTRYYLGRTQSRPSGGTNHIIIPSPTISKEHGKFKIENDQVLYADLNSTNGTIHESDGVQYFLHGNSHYAQLKSGDMLRIQPDEKSPEKSVLILYSGSSDDGIWRRYALMAQTTMIGSAMDNDIVLDDDNVVPVQAAVENRQGSCIIVDRRKNGGILLNGKKVQDSATLQEKDVIRIGDHTMIYSAGSIFFKSRKCGFHIEVRNINKSNPKEKRPVLKQVSCTIESNSFVTIAGKPGMGKTAFLNVLSGNDTDYTGDVWMNGINTRENFEELKSRIGYVPAEDIIYDDLKLGRMLWLSAKLRLPADFDKKRMEERLDRVLSMMELTECRNVFIRNLTPEQRKKANIAVELLTDPEVLCLNEPTFGLDSGAELNLMIILNRLAKSQGKTVIMSSTHAPENIQICDKVLFMDPGGMLCFVGNIDQAKMFFGEQNLSDIYNRIAQDPEEWAAQYHNAVSAGRAAQNSAAPSSEAFNSARDRERGGYSTSYHKGNAFTAFFQGFHISQFPTLFVRTTELITNNWKRMLLLFGQPLAFALIMILLVHENIYTSYDEYGFYMSALRIVAVWLGLFDAVQSVNREREILKREYMGNLSIGVYVLAKYIVLSIVGLIQALIMMIVFAAFTEWPYGGYLYRTMFPELTISIWIIIAASIGIGLILSSLIRKPEHSLIVAPFVVIVEAILSGSYYFYSWSSDIFYRLGPVGRFLSNFTVTKWGTRALDIASTYYYSNDLIDLWWWRREYFFGILGDAFLYTWGILFLMILISAIITIVLIHRIVRRR